jgi:DNA-directed RNA polymerase subunit RPC12/RpoP
VSRKIENTGFVCAACGASVPPVKRGGYRNHCPRCLCSLHADVSPGDRACGCLGLMRPIALEHGKKGWQIRHRCETCGFERLNVVCDDPAGPDNPESVLRLLQFGRVDL